MKVIIEIADSTFNYIKSLKSVILGRCNTKSLQYEVIDAIRNGKVIPVDADTENKFEDRDEWDFS